MTANLSQSLEEWRTIPGLERYEASSLGRIRSKLNMKPLRFYLNKDRYTFGAKVEGRLKTFYVARCVCLAFHGLPPGGKNEAMHKDEVGTHDWKDNLEWGSHQENLSTDIVRAKMSAAKKGKIRGPYKKRP